MDKEIKSNGLTVTIMNEEAFNIDDRTIELSEKCLMHETLIKLIEQNVEKLGVKCKHLLDLSWNGKSMKEVADLLNTTHGFARKKKQDVWQSSLTSFTNPRSIIP